MADLQPEAWLFEDTTDKSIQSSVNQKSTLGSHRPKPVSIVAQWLRETSIVHALSK